MNVLYIEGRRNGYGPDQCGRTMTVSEMIDFLSQFDGDLPIYLNTSIMIGGVVRMFMDGRKNVDEKTKNDQVTDGTLYCAGMIAGEGLVGIALAILAVAGISLDVSGVVNFGNIGGVVLMIIMILTLLKFSLWKKKKA